MNLLAFFFLACGPKEPAKTTPEVVTPPPAEKPAEPIIPEPVEEPPPPAIVSNADLNVTLTFADGSTKSGHVIRIEKNKKYNGMGEWREKKSRLTMELTRGNDLKDVQFSDLSKITIKPSSTKKADSDCNFESDYDPRLYWCKQATISKAFLKDGTSWKLEDQYKWKFYFEDESTSEFWVNTHRVLEQESGSVSITDSDINNDLIAKLQEQLATELSANMLVQIDIQ